MEALAGQTVERCSVAKAHSFNNRLEGSGDELNPQYKGVNGSLNLPGSFLR